MARFTRLNIKAAQVARLKILPQAEECEVPAGPDRRGPFSYAPRKGGGVSVLFRHGGLPA